MESTKTILLATLVATSLKLAAAGCRDGPGSEPGAGESRTDLQASEDFDTAAVDSLPGAPGIFNRESGTYRLSIPRDDLFVTVDGVLAPRMATCISTRSTR